MREENVDNNLGKHYSLSALNKVARKQILDNLRRHTTEQRLLGLILHTMIRQLDEQDQALKYIVKNTKHLKIINRASRYAPKIIEASNRVWGEAFKEMAVNVSIADFCALITFKRPKQFKKIGVNAKDFGKLQKAIEGTEITEDNKIIPKNSGYGFKTLKLVNLMLSKIDKEVEYLNKEAL